MNNRVFNWAFAFAHVIPSHKKIFTSTIQKNEELRRLILELKETKGKLSRLDWNAYSNAAISTPFIKKENPAAFIEDLRASISSFSPKIDISIDKEYALIEAERSALIDEATEIEKKVSAEMEFTSDKLERYNTLTKKPVDEFCVLVYFILSQVDDIYFLEPEFKEEFYQLVKDGCWTDSPQIYMEWKARQAAAATNGGAVAHH